jgi:outer membrane protein assembly factor BamB
MFRYPISIAALAVFISAGARADTPSDVLDAAGVQGGIVVQIGVSSGAGLADLRRNERYLIQGLDTSSEAVAKARAEIKAHGVYGKVSAVCFDGRTLPYRDNLVNLIVVCDANCEVPVEEMDRVLVPGGRVVTINARKQDASPIDPVSVRRKHVPASLDSWPQYLHGADNNAVARDRVVGPPRHLQWVSEPAWSRSHMTIASVVSMVSDQGRLFTIEDRATPENPLLPGRWFLIARDAHNGVELWRYPIKRWDSITRYIKDMAIQLQSRLVAAGDVVFCTPGIDQPITVFDAATGEIIRVIEGTEQTQEFKYLDGILYASIGDPMNADRYNIVKDGAGKGRNLGGSDARAPFGGTGFRGRYAWERGDREQTICAIVAIDAETSRELWRIEDVMNYTACSLAVKGNRGVYQTAGGIFCFDPGSGDTVWNVEKQISTGDGTDANTVIITDTHVYSKESTRLFAYSLSDGKEAWTAPIVNNYEKTTDLFFTGGAIWTGAANAPQSYHPATGASLTTIKQRMLKPMGHDRCYRNFITERYYINSKTGGADFLDLESQQEFPNHWTRGTCGMGVLPCNGLLYVPPFSCQCSMAAMINSFNALAPEPGLAKSDQAIDVRRSVRLEKGPAYLALAPSSVALPPSREWPTYRQNARRSGSTESEVSAELAPCWTARVTTKPSAPTIAAGKVFVADVDAHTVLAFDAANGEVAWQYTTGGRVDSPPTYHQGRVLFGSRDGWVYCLRAADGELAWRFKDLPDKMMGAFGQLESAWPVAGSILIKNDIAYFNAGRSSFLDGGIFVYGLDPETGDVIHSSSHYGPFDQPSGFPHTGRLAFKSDIMVAGDELLYVRHRAFNPDLSDAEGAETHIVTAAGFLDDRPQHRTYWSLGDGSLLAGSMKTGVQDPHGDILITDDAMHYEVRGFPVHRHSYFDPRLSGYKLVAGPIAARSTSPGSQRRGTNGQGKRATAGEISGAVSTKPGTARGPVSPETAPNGGWIADIPITGKALIKAGDNLFVAGSTVQYPAEQFEEIQAGYEGRNGGVLWVASARDGEKLAKYELDAPPAWDGIAAAEGRLIIALQDGTVQCFEGR